LSYPFQILAGRNNPVVKAGVASGTPVTSSNSIISLPIFDSGNTIGSSGQTPVTIIGFLQVFISGVDNHGNVVNVHINVHDGLPMRPEGYAHGTPKEVEARKRPKETSSSTISQLFPQIWE
jgi:hypothetical protein